MLQQHGYGLLKDPNNTDVTIVTYCNFDEEEIHVQQCSRAITNKQWKLSVELEDWDGATADAEYKVTTMNDELPVQCSDGMDMDS